jgi:SAM-dependent methyltransferase
MHCDVTELTDFYRRPLGQMVRRLLSHRLRARARNVAGQTVIGLGFATPYLSMFRGEARCVGALMPAAQGALVWPSEDAVQTALVDEEHLPLADNSVDLLIGIHCLEMAERVRPLLRELWRVLRPDGRLILIVTNRTSIWARLDRTPFGHGRPFSRGQIERLLADSLFAAGEWSHALHVPPLEWSFIMRSSPAFERAGARLTPGIGGVILVEARKELAQPIGGHRQRQRSGMFAPIGRPAMPKNTHFGN